MQLLLLPVKQRCGSSAAGSLVISLCRYLVIIVPLAFLLSRVLGAAGVWHAFWITELFTAGIALAVYRKAVQIKV